MKFFLFFILAAFALNDAFAQVQPFAPLSCFTWGPDQYLNFETTQHNAVPEVQGKYKTADSDPPTVSQYEAFGKDRAVYSWLPDDQQYAYINNVQVIRWNIQDDKPYTIYIMNIFDETLYSVSTENSCGVILFPDSIETMKNMLVVKIKYADQQDIRAGLRVINFSQVVLLPRKQEERFSILKELQACNSLECKIEKLKSYKATADILSLLELEKMKDPKNKAVDKLYWEFVSQRRYDFAHRSWER